MLALAVVLGAGVAVAPGVALASSGVSDVTTAAAASADPAAGIPIELQDQLYAALRAARANSIAPGLSLSVVTADGRQWSGSDGWKANGDWLNVGDPLPIGSVTKTFTAACILQLVDEGRIALDAPTSAYLHNVRLVKGTTVRQLLSHTSGIADLYVPALGILQGAPSAALSSNGVLRPIGEPYFEPGTGYHYSNTNYYLLGLIITDVTGRTVQEELYDRFLAPLGLSSTRLLTAADPELPAAWTTAFWTAGAMISTPTELARWGEALYTGNAISSTSMRRMLDFGGGTYYGEGAQLLPLGDRWVPGHSGLLYDTTTLLVHLPEENVSIAIAGTAPNTDLEAALVGSYGGPSLLELIGQLAAG
jgi:D-alanyl-D-alanine carboxypeptidase